MKTRHYPNLYWLALCASAFLLTSCAWHENHNFAHQEWPKYALHNKYRTQETPSDTLKVVSFNIYHDKKVDEAIELFREHPQLKDADFILLQEKDLEGVKKMSRALKYNYVYYPSSIHWKFRKDFGNAVLSKWPIVEEEKIILNGEDAEKLLRIAAGVTARIEDKLIKVYSVHQGVFTRSHKRRDQLENLFHNVSPDIDHVIVGGDFNTISRKNLRVVTETFQDNAFQFATNNVGWTYQIKPLLKKKLTLDQIYVKGFRVIDAGKVIDFGASDHIPIWTEVKLN